jgi:hypothetical protein
VKIGFADPRRSYTKAFERYTLELSRCMTIQDTAHHLGVSWDVVKDIQNRDEHRRLNEALELNQPLATAYYMKEDLRQYWNQPDKHSADIFLRDWMARARSSGIRILIQFANTLGSHKSGLLSITITRSQQALWKGPTTRSRRCKTSLWLQGFGIFQTQNNGHSPGKVRFSRMNPFRFSCASAYRHSPVQRLKVHGSPKPEIAEKAKC